MVNLGPHPRSNTRVCGGVPKGLTQLLQELGLCTSDMKRKVGGDGDKSKFLPLTF